MHPAVKSCTHYDADGQRRRIELDDIPDLLGHQDGFIWLGLYEPDAGLLERLRGLFGLHPLAIEDAATAHQRPKVESYGDTLFVVVHTTQEVDTRLRYGETHLFVGQRFLISIRHAASVSYEPVRQRLENEPDLLRLGPSYCLYAVLDAVHMEF